MKERVDKNSREEILIVEEDERRKRLKLFDVRKIKNYLIYEIEEKVSELNDFSCSSFYKMDLFYSERYMCLGIKYDYYKMDLEYLIENAEVPHDRDNLMLLICDSVNILYENDIINGNLKSSNIIYNEENNQIEIIDSFLNELKITDDLRLYDLNFYSPEEIKNKEMDVSSMIWSIGVIFYEILTNELPFTSEDKNSFMNNYFNLTEQNHYKIPIKILKILKQIFEINPDNRPTINEIKKAIKMNDKNEMNSLQRFPNKFSRKRKENYLIMLNEVGTVLVEHD